MTRVETWLARHWLWFVPLVAITAAFTVSPSDDGPTICPFALCTGTACPGCGLTRAGQWFVRGDIGQAVVYHPMILVVAVWSIGAWVVAIARRRGHHIAVRSRTVAALLAATAGLFVVTWLVRLATGSLPAV